METVEAASMWLMALAAFLLRLALLPLPKYATDVACFMGWSHVMVSHGPAHFYESVAWCDYPPGYLYVLWIVGWFLRIVPPRILETVAPPVEAPIISTTLLSLPAMLADVGIGVLLYRWAKREGKGGRPAWIAALWLFNPVVWIESAVWGQVDSVVTLWLLGTMWAWMGVGTRKGSPVLGAVLLGLALVTKLQAALLLPLLVLWFFKRYPLRIQVVNGLVVIGVVFLVMWPFETARSPEGWLRLFTGPLHGYPFMSVNAFNLWAMADGLWKPDSQRLWGLTAHAWGTCLFGVNALWVLWRVKKRLTPESLFGGAFVTVWSAFFFLTRMHERYAYLALPFALLAFMSTNRRAWLVLMVLVSATTTVNLVYALSDVWPVTPELTIASGLRALTHTTWARNIASWLNLWVWYRSMKELRRLTDERTVSDVHEEMAAHDVRVARPVGPSPRSSSPTPRLRLTWRVDGVIAVLLWVSAFSVYTVRLGVPSVEHYDEVHHVKTARQFLHGEEVTEWTHPHLGKLMMAASMALAGETPFAWRLPQAIMGSVVIACLYLLGAVAFQRRAIGGMAAILLLHDGMQFTLSRIGMLDVHATAWIMVTYLFCAIGFAHGWRGTTRVFVGVGTALGLALASKWTACYAAAGTLVIIAASLWQTHRASGILRQDLAWPVVGARALVGLVLLPTLIYLLSYAPYVLQGHSLVEVLKTQQGMWGYHAGIKETHTYSSPWWSWPWLVRPVWTYFQAPTPDQRAGIVILGNPLIFWLVIPALAYLAWRVLSRRDWGGGLVLGAFCVQYLPWSFSPRSLLFVHHFYSALPFGCLAIAVALHDLWSASTSSAWYRGVVGGYLVVVIGLFWYFYPILSALPISASAFHARQWFRSWI